MKGSTVALLVTYGPEYRAFLQSGLAEAIGRHFDVRIYCRCSTGVEGSHHPFPTQCLQPRVLSALAGRGLHRLALGAWPGPTAWRRRFQRDGIAAVVAASFSGARALPALAAAQWLGLKRYVLLNSWKDAYQKPCVPILLDGLGVFDEASAEHLRSANPRLEGESVFHCGSLHFDAFSRAGVWSREDYCTSVGLDSTRPFWCYTAAAPGVEPRETEVVGALAAGLRGRPGSAQLLVRLNPRDGDDRFRGLANVVVQRPRWVYDSAQDWNVPLPADLSLWRSTVEHAAGNFSAPSTVTAEFAARAKPVVNLRFVEDGLSDELRRVYERTFARYALSVHAVSTALQAVGMRAPRWPSRGGSAVSLVAERLCADQSGAASGAAAQSIHLSGA